MDSLFGPITNALTLVSEVADEYDIEYESPVDLIDLLNTIRDGIHTVRTREIECRGLSTSLTTHPQLFVVDTGH